MYKKYQSTKSKFIVDGVFRAEVNELLQTALADYGFSGIEVNFTKRSTEVRVLVSKFKELMNQKSIKSGFKINELRLLIEQRFGSGKLRQQRAKSMKFKDGYLIHTGEPKRIFIDSAVRHIELRQGIMGVKVKIMLPYNARAGENRGFGVPHPLPDVITFHENKKNE